MPSSMSCKDNVWSSSQSSSSLEAVNGYALPPQISTISMAFMFTTFPLVSITATIVSPSRYGHSVLRKFSTVELINHGRFTEIHGRELEEKLKVCFSSSVHFWDVGIGIHKISVLVLEGWSYSCWSRKWNGSVGKSSGFDNSSSITFSFRSVIATCHWMIK